MSRTDRQKINTQDQKASEQGEQKAAEFHSSVVTSKDGDQAIFQEADGWVK
jgi:hypothetical protein